MSAIVDALTTLVNGTWLCVRAAMSPTGIATSLLAMSMAWLALIEIELMNRTGAKPQVGTH